MAFEVGSKCVTVEGNTLHSKCFRYKTVVTKSKKKVWETLQPSTPPTILLVARIWSRSAKNINFLILIWSFFKINTKYGKEHITFHQYYMVYISIVFHSPHLHMKFMTLQSLLSVFYPWQWQILCPRLCFLAGQYHNTGPANM